MGDHWVSAAQHLLWLDLGGWPMGAQRHHVMFPVRGDMGGNSGALWSFDHLLQPVCPLAQSGGPGPIAGGGFIWFQRCVDDDRFHLDALKIASN